MIKIYFDHNVYQDLKKSDNEALLKKVMAAKEFAVFCFSEAHLYDLNQDKTDEKFNDMKFIESITDSNCYFFTDRTQFNYRTPTEYYEDFDWSETNNYNALLESMSTMFQDSFKAIPLPFNNLLKADDLSMDMPEGMKKLLLGPSTMYDFLTEMISFTNELSTEQVKFKEHLKYLHKNSKVKEMYEGAGIEGFDGFKVTDKDKFWRSYAQKFIIKGREKLRYDLFIEMYNGLEIFGLVKGKPKKQKMINLLNDGRHAFFGTVCDIIVSKDSDFIEKTKFMYDIENCNTRIAAFNDLAQILDELDTQSKVSISELFDEIVADQSSYEIFHVNDSEGQFEEFVRLKNKYLMYFNLMGYMSDQEGSYRSILSEKINYSNGTLTKQIEYVIKRLTSEFGPDLDEKGEFNVLEELKNKSTLRNWKFNNLIVSLILDNTLFLNFYPVDYLRNKSEKQTIQTI